jgi:hypothetical protein
MTVPVIIEFGIDPHAAVATNMMALIFMSLGGSLPFARKDLLELCLLPVCIALTLVGSANRCAAVAPCSSASTPVDDCPRDDCSRGVFVDKKRQLGTNQHPRIEQQKTSRLSRDSQSQR